MCGESEGNEHFLRDAQNGETSEQAIQIVLVEIIIFNATIILILSLQKKCFVLQSKRASTVFFRISLRDLPSEARRAVIKLCFFSFVCRLQILFELCKYSQENKKEKRRTHKHTFTIEQHAPIFSKFYISVFLLEAIIPNSYCKRKKKFKTRVFIYPSAL